MLMFLKKPLLEAVRQGRKTQTLRRQRLRLAPGHVISFGGHVRVVVSAVDRVRTSELDLDDARREGFSSLGQLRATLASLGLDTVPELTRIRFALRELD